MGGRDNAREEVNRTVPSVGTRSNELLGARRPISQHVLMTRVLQCHESEWSIKALAMYGTRKKVKEGWWMVGEIRDGDGNFGG